MFFFGKARGDTHTFIFLKGGQKSNDGLSFDWYICANKEVVNHSWVVMSKEVLNNNLSLRYY